MCTILEMVSGHSILILILFWVYHNIYVIAVVCSVKKEMGTARAVKTFVASSNPLFFVCLFLFFGSFVFIFYVFCRYTQIEISTNAVADDDVIPIS